MLKCLSFKVVGIIMVLLSMFSLIAYNCHFHETFTQSPYGYMFHLIYYRSHHCDNFVDWSLLVANASQYAVPQMPDEIHAVSRAFWIALNQLIFNSLLVITTVHMLG